jgi:hypothetical protein
MLDEPRTRRVGRSGDLGDAASVGLYSGATADPVCDFFVALGAAAFAAFLFGDWCRFGVAAFLAAHRFFKASTMFADTGIVTLGLSDPS